MEVEEESGSKPLETADDLQRENLETDRVRVKRKTLQAVLEQCQKALELLSTTGVADDDDDNDRVRGDLVEDDGQNLSSRSQWDEREADELCDLLKSRVEQPDFLEKLEGAQASIPHNVPEEGGSWDMVSDSDVWEGSNSTPDQEDFVVVRQEDIVEGIACFMAAYLLSLKETKELTPNQLQEALSKTFSVKKKKGKLRKAWDGSKVIYNIASWGATAVGIYQNPVILQAASKAFWTSCQVISKLL